MNPSSVGPRPSGDSVETSDLTAAQRLLLQIYRQWLRGVTNRDARHWQQAWCEISTAMPPAVAREALSALEALLCAIAGHATRVVAFHPPCCGLLARDELAVLHLVAGAQHGRGVSVKAVARDLVSPFGVASVVEAAEALGFALTAGGLRLPAPPIADDGAAVVRLDEYRAARRTLH